LRGYARGVLPELTVYWRPWAHAVAGGRDALAYWRRQRAMPGRPARLLRTDTAAFVTHVTGLAGTPIPDEERG